MPTFPTKFRNTSFRAQFLLGLLLVPFGATAQTPPIQWDRTFGGNNTELAYAILPTTDGGYLLGGGSPSGVGGNKTEPNRGFYDYWIVKTDANGNKQWEKAYGGTQEEGISTMVATPDGGYLLGGTSYSDVGGEKSQPSRGSADYWIVKIGPGGQKQWDKTLGGNSEEYLNQMVATPDGGYLLGGSSYSDIGYDRSESSRGWADYWVVKVDAGGNKLWDRRYGGSNWDNLTALVPAGDGGYLLGGYSNSHAGYDKTEWGRGDDDYWLVRIDASGNKLWDKTFGGNSYERLASVLRTQDGGYLMGGWSISTLSGDHSQPVRGGIDYWVLKLDAGGNKLWDRRYGGPGMGTDVGGSSGDYLQTMVATAQGGYLLAGWSDSGAGGDKSEDSRGERDFWLVHIAADGRKQWDKTMGGNYSDFLGAVLATGEGGYVVLGHSGSLQGQEKTTPLYGGDDYWLVKLGPDPAPAGQLRINAGGGAFTAIDQRKFRADAYFQGGTVSTPVSNAIAGTGDDFLYQTGRHGASFAYNLPTGNGTFDVVLHFAETYWGNTAPGGVGSRRFHVNMEGVRKLTDYDVFAKAGGALRVRQETFRVRVTDGMLNVAFLKGAADNPAVKAIEVLPAGNAHFLNAGGGVFTGADGKTFSPDAYFANGSVSAIPGGNILNTTNDALYHNARFGAAFSYGIPAANGTYDVVLHFAETYFGARAGGGAGSRRFNVDVEGTRRLTNYDIFAKAGGAMRAVRETLRATVTDGVLNLLFSRGSADNPAVSAIELVPVAVPAREATVEAGLRQDGPQAGRLHPYPNPVTDVLTVGLPFPATEVTGTWVTDAKGVVRLRNAHEVSGENQVRVGTASLPKGLYVLRLAAGGGQRTVKFVRE